MDIEAISSQSSEDQESQEIQSLNDIVNSESSEGQQITEEGIRSIERIAALKIKDHSEEEKKQRQQKKQIMDFKVRVAHLLEIYLQKAPKLIGISKIVNSIFQTHSQALSENNIPLLTRTRTLLKLALRRGKKEQPAELIICLKRSFQKLISSFLNGLRKNPKNASQIQKIILSIVISLQNAEQGQEKGQFLKILRATLKTIMVHCFQGHLPHLDIHTLKQLITPLQSDLIMVAIKSLSTLILESQNNGARTEYQRIKAISLFEYCSSLILKRQAGDHLSKLYSIMVRTLKASLEGWNGWKNKPFKKIRPLFLSFVRAHRILREKELANITDNGMKIIKKASQKIEDEGQRNNLIKLFHNVVKE